VAPRGMHRASANNALAALRGRFDNPWPISRRETMNPSSTQLSRGNQLPTVASHASTLLRIIAIGLPVMALDAALQVALEHLQGGRGIAVALVAIVGAAAMLVLYALLVRRVEKRPVLELARTTAPLEAAGGLAAGFVLFSLVVGWVTIAGKARLGGFHGAVPLAMPLATSLVAAVGEELAFRGAIFRTLRERYGAVLAIAVSALLFGGIHAANPNATWLSSLAIALEAGVLLAFVYMTTGRLWLGIGLHFGWNFTEAAVYGTAVSGYRSTGLFDVTPVSAQPLWTGGAFGLEGSLPAVVVCLVVSALIALGMCRVRR
jgi:uncharacterized protein